MKRHLLLLVLSCCLFCLVFTTKSINCQNLSDLGDFLTEKIGEFNPRSLPIISTVSSALESSRIFNVLRDVHGQAFELIKRGFDDGSPHYDDGKFLNNTGMKFAKAGGGTALNFVFGARDFLTEKSEALKNGYDRLKDRFDPYSDTVKTFQSDFTETWGKVKEYGNINESPDFSVEGYTMSAEERNESWGKSLYQDTVEYAREETGLPREMIIYKDPEMDPYYEERIQSYEAYASLKNDQFSVPVEMFPVEQSGEQLIDPGMEPTGNASNSIGDEGFDAELDDIVQSSISEANEIREAHTVKSTLDETSLEEIRESLQQNIEERRQSSAEAFSSSSQAAQESIQRYQAVSGSQTGSSAGKAAGGSDRSNAYWTWSRDDRELPSAHPSPRNQYYHGPVPGIAR